MHTEYTPEIADTTTALASALAYALLFLGLMAAAVLITAIARTYRTLPATAAAPARALRATLMVLIGGPIRIHRTRMAAVRRDAIVTSGAVYRITGTDTVLHLLRQAS